MRSGAADGTVGSTGGATRVARSGSGAAVVVRRPFHVDARTSARMAPRVVLGAAVTGVTKPVDAIVTTVRWDKSEGRQRARGFSTPDERGEIEGMGWRAATDDGQWTSYGAATRGRDSTATGCVGSGRLWVRGGAGWADRPGAASRSRGPPRRDRAGGWNTTRGRDPVGGVRGAAVGRLGPLGLPPPPPPPTPWRPLGWLKPPTGEIARWSAAGGDSGQPQTGHAATNRWGGGGKRRRRRFISTIRSSATIVITDLVGVLHDFAPHN